jgi:transcription elongation factor GreA
MRIPNQTPPPDGVQRSDAVAQAGGVGSLAVSEGSNLTTAEGLEALNADLAELEGQGRREIAERIKTAREWGDLKENSEYHDAKNEQAHLETKIARLREKIADAVIVEEEPAGAAGVVGFGSTVVVRDQDGGEQTWRIVSSHDAAPKEGRLSAESPVAVALLGRATGDQTSVSLPRGKRTLTVVSVS